MFEAMKPEGRLAVIQKKQLCQSCFRHPDTKPCAHLPCQGMHAHALQDAAQGAYAGRGQAISPRSGIRAGRERGGRKPP
jgi:hypothetical protein